MTQSYASAVKQKLHFQWQVAYSDGETVKQFKDNEDGENKIDFKRSIKSLYWLPLPLPWVKKSEIVQPYVYHIEEDAKPVIAFRKQQVVYVNGAKDFDDIGTGGSRIRCTYIVGCERKIDNETKRDIIYIQPPFSVVKKVLDKFPYKFKIWFQPNGVKRVGMKPNFVWKRFYFKGYTERSDKKHFQSMMDKWARMVGNLE